MKRSTRSAIVIPILMLAAWYGPGVGLAQTGDDQTPDAAAPAASSPATAGYPWPNQFTEDSQAFTVYPPQLDRWQGDRLEGQAAVAVRSEGAEQPVFGLVWLWARTEVDAATGMVKVKDITATRASFPTATAQAGAYLNAVRRHLSAMTWNVTRERLESELAIQHASRDVQSQPLRNTPPRILYSESPAILVPIDGTPQLKEMAGLGLLRVVNTRALILQDKATRRFYLFVAGHWLEAPAIEGPWTEAYVRPSALEEAKQQALANGQVELVEGGESAADRVPVVYVATGPAELVQTDGPPQYVPIQGTNLLYVTNTPNRLFFDLTAQRYYLLLSGRWYRTASLSQSNWEYVPGTSLPADFALIPQDHPTEAVRASVPGTPQAQEAVIANGVPQVAAVKRTAATLEITYDGPPQFQPIAGTPLQSVVNAPMPVIEVDPGSFYALDNGVWFVSNSAFGPWTVATWVPPVIYTIPRSSALHYVTYVRVYEATPEVVYEGYSPGYVGSYVAPGATVVYGTGWDYQPWIGTVWYAPPLTWGFGFSFYSSWWGPWPYSPWFWAGWAPYPWYRPWWGPWCAPVAFVPHGAHVVVARGVATVPANRVAVGNIHANTANVTHIFQRWGHGTATPLGAPGTLAAGGTGTHRTAATGPGSPAFGGRPALAGAPGSAQNVQGFRHVDGQWQRFQGHGQWQNVTAPNPNASRMQQSPPMAQGRALRPGTPGGAPVAGGAPMRGPSGWMQSRAMPPSSSQFASGPPANNRSFGSTAPRSAAPAPMGAGGTQPRAFAPRVAGYGQGWGGGAPPMGRSGPVWVPNSAAAMGGANNMGGRQPMAGGRASGGRGGWGGGGGGHMR
ncbi:MAG TPA: hypothetical protein VMH26_05670 [Burkholderiales bacterium]|nr:hypothetical protein [Burkholderiales bacterium]